MKNVALPVAAAVLASITTLAGSELLKEEPSSRTAAGAGPSAARLAQVAPESSSASGERRGGEALLPVDDGRVARLEDRLRAIEARLDSLSRVPVAAQATPRDTEEAGDTTLIAGADPRSFVLDVLEEDRLAREAEREAERQARNAERIQQRAASIAEELGLSTKEQESLYGVLLQEDSRRNELFTTMRNGDMAFGDRETMRTEFGKIREWKEQEVLSLFGAALGEQINDKSSDRGFGGGPGGGRRGGGGDGGGGFPGGGGGGGGRRGGGGGGAGGDGNTGGGRG